MSMEYVQRLKALERKVEELERVVAAMQAAVALADESPIKPRRVKREASAVA